MKSLKNLFKAKLSLGYFVFVILIFIAFNSSNSQNWLPLDGGVGPGHQYSTTVYPATNGSLITSGRYGDVMRWDGSTYWWLIGRMRTNNAGTPWVWAFTVYNGQLIVGGYFSSADSVPAFNVTKWNGTTWSPLGSGTSSTVYALTVYGGELIAGGRFTTAGGVSASLIAKWNGSSWSPLGTGIGGGSTPEVSSLTVYNGELIVGGVFTTAGGIAANSIAKWNGSSWSALGSGINGGMGDLIVYGGQLIAGGAFTIAGGVSANNIAKWNGSSWSPLGLGTGGSQPNGVSSLAVYGNDLIAGGWFTTAGGISANRVARWNGSSWSAMGSGMNNIVFALTTYGTDVIAAGAFTIAGGNDAFHIAKWNDNVGINTSGENIPSGFKLFQNYPNPFNSETIISFALPVNSAVKIIIYDAVGKFIRELTNAYYNAGFHSLRFNAEDLPSGLYFYKLAADSFGETGKFSETHKLLFLK